MNNHDIPIMLDGSDPDEARRWSKRVEELQPFFEAAIEKKKADLDTPEKRYAWAMEGLELMQEVWAVAAIDKNDGQPCVVDADAIMDFCIFAAWLVERSGEVLFPEDPHFQRVVGRA